MTNFCKIQHNLVLTIVSTNSLVLESSSPSVVADRLDDDERAKSDLGRQGNGTIINLSILTQININSVIQKLTHVQ